MWLLGLLIVLALTGLVVASDLRPPTLAEFAAMAEAGRMMAERPFLCDRGPGVLRYYSRVEAPGDQEWAVALLSWRPDRPHVVIHYPPGADAHADGLWVDQDGDGIFEIALAPLDDATWRTHVPASPCLAD